MIHVEIEEQEGETGLLITKLAPATDTRQGGIPSLIGMIGLRGEPEIAMVEHLELLRTIEDGGMLTALLAIVTPYADVVIPRHHALQVLQLRIFSLLRTENIKTMELYQLGDVGATLSPAIAIDGVALIRIANVIRTDDHMLRRTHTQRTEQT